MKNRKNLHDYGLVLIVLGVLHLFMFAATVIAGFVDGTVAKAFETVSADILVAVKVAMGIIIAIMALIVLADVFLGIKALKVSEKPNADKGYIIVAKIFFVISIIAAVSYIVTLIQGGAPVVDTVLNLISDALGAVVYAYFIVAAQAVRKDFLNGVK